MRGHQGYYSELSCMWNQTSRTIMKTWYIYIEKILHTQLNRSHRNNPKVWFHMCLCMVILNNVPDGPSYIFLFLSHLHFSPSIVSPSPTQQFANVFWEQGDKSLWHRCVRCRVTSTLHDWFQMWMLHSRSPTTFITTSPVQTLPTAKSEIIWETAFQQMVCGFCHLWRKTERE